MKNNNAISLARRTLLGSGLGLAAHWAIPAFAATPSPSAAVRRTLRLAVVPQLTPIEMSRYWSPVVDALGQRGIPCELVVYPSIAAFEAEFLSGKADLVFLNPYHMVMAHRAHKYEPLLHDARALEGVLLVSADGPVQQIEQLKGQRISFPGNEPCRGDVVCIAPSAVRLQTFLAHSVCIIMPVWVSEKVSIGMCWLTSGIFRRGVFRRTLRVSWYQGE